eukprot:CAMPEP_0178844334 /NCGR_PEP_ID=MMETSP0746-20121128/16732_1 /TAXON_ID=913974 /ORGANISM="Nitzschia punctata, Strain CCMP561" /LENGTH=39 /DNA_ID= /DNA_START= /DNA_END= /DNA_ORIENTATION=
MLQQSLSSGGNSGQSPFDGGLGDFRDTLDQIADMAATSA